MMNLYHVKYFCDAARFGSVSRSAELNRVSHSAVSQAIRALEETLGVELLAHSKRQFFVTENGARVLREGAALLALAENIKSQDALLNFEATPLRIGVSHTLGREFATGPLAQISRENPGLEIVVRIGNAEVLERQLEAREIEVGIGMDLERFAKFDRRTFHRGKFVLVSRKGKAVLPNVYIVGDKGAEVVRLRAHLAKKNPNASFIEMQSWELICELALRGVGLGLVPDFLARRRSDLKIAPSPLILPSFEVAAFYRPQQELSPAARKFVGLF